MGFKFPRTWKKRYFVMTRDCIYYFPSNEVRNIYSPITRKLIILQDNKQQKGEVILNQVTRPCPEIDPKITQKKPFVFIVETKSRYDNVCLLEMFIVLQGISFPSGRSEGNGGMDKHHQLAIQTTRLISDVNCCCDTINCNSIEHCF